MINTISEIVVSFPDFLLGTSGDKWGTSEQQPRRRFGACISLKIVFKNFLVLHVSCPGHPYRNSIVIVIFDLGMSGDKL